jgi:hypothetical protein
MATKFISFSINPIKKFSSKFFSAELSKILFSFEKFMGKSLNGKKIHKKCHNH